MTNNKAIKFNITKWFKEYKAVRAATKLNRLLLGDKFDRVAYEASCVKKEYSDG